FAILTDMHRLKDKSIIVALTTSTISSRKRKSNRHGHRHDRQTRGRSCHREHIADQEKVPCPKCNKVHEESVYALR
ncbi:hypothetical protein SDJN03_04043, partial [Cucurbita argyrosperma subsp. sororia]